jgi:hypothetical protein
MINGLQPSRVIELLNEMLKENLDEIRHAIMNEVINTFPCYPMQPRVRRNIYLEQRSNYEPTLSWFFFVH